MRTLIMLPNAFHVILGIAAVVLLLLAIHVFIKVVIFKLGALAIFLSAVILALSAYFAIGLCSIKPGLSMEATFIFGRLLANTSYMPIVGLMSILAFNIYGMISYTRKRRAAMIKSVAIRESMDYLPDGICFFGEDGTSILANAQFIDLYRTITGEKRANLNTFVDLVRSGEFGGRAEKINDFNLATLKLRDSSVWAFRKKEIEVDGKVVSEAIANNITEEYELKQELEKNNKRMERICERLKYLNENIEQITKENETLQLMTEVHNNLGSNLLGLRKYLMEEPEKRSRDTLLFKWKNSVDFKIKQLSEDDILGIKPLEDLEIAAQVIGLRLIKKYGDAPDIPIIRYIFSVAVQVCMTNTVRHAKGTEMYLEVYEKGGYAFLDISNNGIQPEKEIQEGNGLTGLRKLVNKQGGQMLIKYVPKFVVSIRLPIQN